MKYHDDHNIFRLDVPVQDFIHVDIADGLK